MDKKDFKILLEALPLVISKESGLVTPYVDFSNTTIVSLTYPFDFITKSKKGHGLQSVYGITGGLYFIGKHEIKEWSYRTNWLEDELTVRENNQNGITQNIWKFNYKELNDYIFYRNKELIK